MLPFSSAGYSRVTPAKAPKATARQWASLITPGPAYEASCQRTHGTWNAYLNRAIAAYLTWSRPVLMGAGEFTIGADYEAGTGDLFLSGPLWISDVGRAPECRIGAGRHPANDRADDWHGLKPA